MASEREKSPRRTMCAAVLSLEGLSVALVTPVMISIAGVSAGLALGLGLGLAVVCFVAAGMLRRPWGYGLGWAVQAAAIALGVVVTMMYAVGVVFAILWITADLVGRKIDSERAAAFAAYDRLTESGHADEVTGSDQSPVERDASA